MESKTVGKVSFNVVGFNKIQDLHVVVSFECPKLDWFVLRKLLREKATADTQYHEGGCVTAAAYALFKTIEYRLMGEPKNQLKFQASDMLCSVNDNNFSIRFKCPGRQSSLMRILKEIIKFSDPYRCAPGFRHACSNLGCKPDMAALDEVARGVNKGIGVVAVGKIKLSMPKPKTTSGGVGTKGSDSEDDDSDDKKDGDGDMGSLSVSGGAGFKNPMEYIATTLNSVFPKIDAGRGIALFKQHGFAPTDQYVHLKSKVTIGSYLAVMYVEANSEVKCDVMDGLVAWDKNFETKRKKLAESDKIKNWLSGNVARFKENTMAVIMMNLINRRGDFPSVDLMVQMSPGSLGAEIQKALA
jgi:hypothetical protein